jgi:FkbM family methyltransferase
MDTKNKILIATAAYRVISLFRRWFGMNDHLQACRGGIKWDLELNEGIDFSIFLLGGFEMRTLQLYKQLLAKKANAIVMDIGANIGSHTLPLAQLVVPGGGTVYAFEPTDYAYGKLLRNIALNPSIGAGVVPLQVMLVSDDGKSVEQEIFSSWPLNNRIDLHPVHRGQLKSTSGAQAFSLDSFVSSRKIESIEFIKLDVDGHEPDVLAGAWLSVERFRPSILMEWSPHLFKENASPMRLVMSRLLDMGYQLFDGATGEMIMGGHDELDRRTPRKGSVNILFRHRENN